MNYSDYIPLTATTRSHRSANPRDVRFGPQNSGRRRRIVLGSALAFILVAALYFISADLLDEAEDIFLDDSDIVYPEFQAAYLPFEPPATNRSTDATARLTPTQVLPDDCRDAYFSAGALCYDPDLPRMDVIWTWVNGSDGLLERAKLEVESRFSSDDPYRPMASASQARQYRYACSCPRV
jgi:hypothetical protein